VAEVAIRICRPGTSRREDGIMVQSEDDDVLSSYFSKEIIHDRVANVFRVDSFAAYA